MPVGCIMVAGRLQSVMASAGGHRLAVAASAGDALVCVMEPTAHPQCLCSGVFGLPALVDALMHSNDDVLMPC